MSQRAIHCVVGWMLIVAVVLCVPLVGFRRAVRATAQSMERPVVILDPGHGGIDGGATSADGVVEKDINLAIALQLRELLQISGFSVVMTRETDCSIHDPGATTIRQIKSTDIHNRFRMMQQYPDAIFISIHQNHFTQSKYSGAQFFYAPSGAGSKALAACFRTAVRAQLQLENTREIKPCGSSVYLIYHATGTAVLAECGFLSNSDEARRLASEEYQKQMAFALYTGLMQYCDSDNDTEPEGEASNHAE